MTEERIKELRLKFYAECSLGITMDSMGVEDTFQWIVDNVIKAKEEEEPLWSAHEDVVCPKCGGDAYDKTHCYNSKCDLFIYG